MVGLKFAVVVCFLIGISLADEAHKEAKLKFQNQCIKETGYTVEGIQAARKGNFGDEATLTKYLVCIFKKIKFLKPDGTFDVSLAKSQIPANVDKAAAEAFIDECLSVAGETTEAKVLAAFKCYTKKRTFAFI